MPLNNAAQWKARAQEARVLAQALNGHPEAHAAMLKIAREYERLAVRAAQQNNSSVMPVSSSEPTNKSDPAKA
jgi:hypothetical protein